MSLIDRFELARTDDDRADLRADRGIDRGIYAGCADRCKRYGDLAAVAQVLDRLVALTIARDRYKAGVAEHRLAFISGNRDRLDGGVAEHEVGAHFAV